MATKSRKRKISQKVKDNVRISNYSDLDILEAMHVIEGSEKNGAGVKTENLAKRLFGDLVKKSEALKYAEMCVTARMSWMRHFGFVEKVEKGVWRASEFGEAMRTAHLPTSFCHRIITSKDTDALQLTRQVGIRILMTTDNDMAFRAMERQLRYSITQRKRKAK